MVFGAVSAVVVIILSAIYTKRAIAQRLAHERLDSSDTTEEVSLLDMEAGEQPQQRLQRGEGLEAGEQLQQRLQRGEDAQDEGSVRVTVRQLGVRGRGEGSPQQQGLRQPRQQRGDR